MVKPLRSDSTACPLKGKTKPFRPVPSDFRESYIRLGWQGVTTRYRVHARCIARWIEQCGGDDLRRERSHVTGRPLRPEIRSSGYAWAHGQAAGGAGAWLRGPYGSFRLLLRPEHRPAASVAAHDLTASECQDVVRLALIGGGMAVIDRELVAVTPCRAARFVRQQLAAQPLSYTHRIAQAVLGCAGSIPLGTIGAIT